jgi:hypothetical protein
MDLFFFSEDLSKVAPNNYPIVIFRISVNNKVEYYTTSEDFKNLAKKSLLKESLKEEVVNKRVRESKDMDWAGQISKLTEFYEKQAQLSILRAKIQQTQAS